MYLSARLLDVINIVLAGIFLKPIFILWIISFFLGRRKGDPARIGFTWMKVLYPAAFLAMFLSVVTLALDLVYLTSDGEALYASRVRLAPISALFIYWTGILLFITQAELAIGFLYALTLTRTSLQKVIRYSTFSVSFLLFVLSIANVGLTESVYNEILGESSFDSAKALSMRHLSGAVLILFWVASLPFVGITFFAMRSAHSLPHLRPSSVLLFVTSILNLFQYTYRLALTAKYTLAARQLPLSDGENIADYVIEFWTLFVILVLLFTMSVRKRNGLWTTPQPWMGGPPAAMASMQQQHPGTWQGQQPQQPYPGPGATYYQPPPQIYGYGGIPLAPAQPKPELPNNQIYEAR